MSSKVTPQSPITRTTYIMAPQLTKHGPQTGGITLKGPLKAAVVASVKMCTEQGWHAFTLTIEGGTTGSYSDRVPFSEYTPRKWRRHEVGGPGLPFEGEEREQQ